MFCPVYGIPIQKCVTFARRLGPVFTAILSALALAEKSPGHICTHLPKGVAPPPRTSPRKTQSCNLTQVLHQYDICINFTQTQHLLTLNTLKIFKMYFPKLILLNVSVKSVQD